MNPSAIATVVTEIVTVLDQCKYDEGLKLRLHEIADTLNDPMSTPETVHAAAWAAGRSISGMGSILDGHWTPRDGSALTEAEVAETVNALTRDLYELTKDIEKPEG